MLTADTDRDALTDAPAAPPRAVVVMGPAGSGKSFVGARLAAALGWHFADGDSFHPPENVARMHAGLPLGDAERAPWLAALRTLLARQLAERAPIVLACSALRVAYRRALVPDGAAWGSVRFLYLRADPALLARRLAARPTHFFAPGLLASQLATLEPPGAGEREPAPVLTLDVDDTADDAEAVVARARALLDA